MKKIYLAISLMAAGLTFTSCANDEDDVFDKSAAQRLNESVDFYKNLLNSSTNGWAMEYFPADGTYGGHLYTAKFNNGSVELKSTASEFFGISYGGKHFTNEDSYSSLYKVISEQGIVLTFDTYNPLLHALTEPLGSSYPEGYEGDYEFIFQRTSENQDTIILKGKRYGNEVRMYKLNEDAGSHIEKATLNSMIFASLPEEVELNIGGEAVTVGIDADYEQLVYEDADEQEQTVAIVPTAQGFRLMNPIEINGQTLQDFKFNSSTNYFESTDGKAAIVYDFPDAEDQVFPIDTQFQFAQADDELAGYIDELDLHNYPSYSLYSFVSFYIGANMSTSGSRTIPLCIGGYYSLLGIFGSYPQYGINWEVDKAAGTMSITASGRTATYSGIYPTVFGPIVNHIIDNSPYDYEFVMAGPVVARIKLVSQKDKNVWFTLKK